MVTITRRDKLALDYRDLRLWIEGHGNSQTGYVRCFGKSEGANIYRADTQRLDNIKRALGFAS